MIPSLIDLSSHTRFFLPWKLSCLDLRRRKAPAHTRHRQLDLILSSLTIAYLLHSTRTLLLILNFWILSSPSVYVLAQFSLTTLLFPSSGASVAPVWLRWACSPPTWDPAREGSCHPPHLGPASEHKRHQPPFAVKPRFLFEHDSLLPTFSFGFVYILLVLQYLALSYSW